MCPAACHSITSGVSLRDASCGVTSSCAAAAAAWKLRAVIYSVSRHPTCDTKGAQASIHICAYKQRRQIVCRIRITASLYHWFSLKLQFGVSRFFLLCYSAELHLQESILQKCCLDLEICKCPDMTFLI